LTKKYDLDHTMIWAPTDASLLTNQKKIKEKNKFPDLRPNSMYFCQIFYDIVKCDQQTHRISRKKRNRLHTFKKIQKTVPNSNFPKNLHFWPDICIVTLIFIILSELHENPHSRPSEKSITL
jgi:hypothetical protein